eukprot:1120079-Alexandrium_andersonii.AAC.1
MGSAHAYPDGGDFSPQRYTEIRGLSVGALGGGSYRQGGPLEAALVGGAGFSPSLPATLPHSGPGPAE